MCQRNKLAHNLCHDSTSEEPFLYDVFFFLISILIFMVVLELEKSTYYFEKVQLTL